MWTALIKPALDLASTAIKGKQQIKQARIDAEQQRILNDQNWEVEALKNTGLKDDFWTLIFGGIVIACFIPSAQPYVFEGFKALDQTPVWFQVAIGMSVSASFGIKAYNLFKR